MNPIPTSRPITAGQVEVNIASFKSASDANERLFNGLRAAINWCVENEPDADLTFPTSIEYQIHRYGRLSEKQVAAITKWITRIAKLAAGVDRPSASRWVGAVGSSVQLGVELLSVRQIDTRFGTCLLFKFVDHQGNDISLFQSRDSKKLFPDVIGKRYLINAKVKSCDEYKGAKQTTISHVKILRSVDAKAPVANVEAPVAV